MNRFTRALDDARPFFKLLLAVALLPLTILYGIYAMWRTGYSTQRVRVAVTLVGGLVAFAMLGIAWSNLGLLGGSDTPQASETGTKPAAAAPSLNWPKEATVTRVIDGDTIEVSLVGTDETATVRFIGVDAPEYTTEVEPFGEEATAYATRMLHGKTVYLESDNDYYDDSYSRLLAYVWLGIPKSVTDESVRGDLFNARLLLDGYASLMTIAPNLKYVDYLKGFEAEAKQAGKGLWAGTASSGSAATTTPESALSPAPESNPAPDAPYVANTNSGKFHRASCPWVARMKPENKLAYSDRAWSIADGYVPCKTCNP